MFLSDIDPQFIKSINYLYSGDNMVRGHPVPLQFYLEEAIKTKSGISKDLTSLVSSSLKQRRATDLPPFVGTIEESKASNSDDELELDLFNEDLMCIVCNGMDVGARNRLLECSDCHKLYHQECHKPIVFIQDSYDSWICQNCKDTKMKVSPIVQSSATNPAKASPNKSNSSSSHRHSSSSGSSSSYKFNTATGSTRIPVTKNEKYSTPTSSSSSSSSLGKSASGTVSKSAMAASSSSSSSSSSSTSRTSVTPNINIISADKRIQIMKKRAAKLQEKRKHLPR